MSAIINHTLSQTMDPQAKKTWRTPVLTELGKFSSLVLQGGGKLSATTGDPGEPRKVPSTG